MKLRNKKTGKIGNFCYGYTNELCVSWQKDDGFWEKQEYNSLAELNADWEDAPEEPKEYWHINAIGAVGLHTRTNGMTDSENLYIEDCQLEIGNHFETEKEAKKAVEKLKAWKRLEDKRFRFNGYDVANRGGDDVICGQVYFKAGNYDREEIEDDLYLLFGGEE